MKHVLANILALTALNLSSAAFAADIAKAPAIPAPPPVWTWTGLYLGINGGYGFGSNDITQAVAPTFTSAGNTVVAPKGGLFGGQLGYNAQFGHAVLGVEGDAQWADLHDKACGLVCANPFNGILPVEQKLAWFATLRGRLGWANDGYLVYVTGGGAWGKVDETDSYIFQGFGSGSGSFSTTKSGWTAGGGVEVRLWGSWTGKIEYLHMDLGSTTNVVPIVPPLGGLTSLTTSSNLRTDMVRAGLNYKLDLLR